MEGIVETWKGGYVESWTTVMHGWCGVEIGCSPPPSLSSAGQRLWGYKESGMIEMVGVMGRPMEIHG